MRSLQLCLIALISLSSTAFAGDLGKKQYEKKCATCHGKDGKGQTEMGLELKVANLTDAELQKKITDAEIIKQITDGNEAKKMPAFKEKLSEEEIKAVALYVRTFKT